MLTRRGNFLWHGCCILGQITRIDCPYWAVYVFMYSALIVGSTVLTYNLLTYGVLMTPALTAKSKLSKLIAQLDTNLCALSPLPPVFIQDGDWEYHVQGCFRARSQTAMLPTNSSIFNHLEEPCFMCCLDRSDFLEQLGLDNTGTIHGLKEFVDQKALSETSFSSRFVEFLASPKYYHHLPPGVLSLMSTFHKEAWEVIREMLQNTLRPPVGEADMFYVVDASIWRGSGVSRGDRDEKLREINAMHHTYFYPLCGFAGLYCVKVSELTSFNDIIASAVRVPTMSLTDAEELLRTTHSFQSDGMALRDAVHTALAVK